MTQSERSQLQATYKLFYSIRKSAKDNNDSELFHKSVELAKHIKWLEKKYGRL